MKGNAIICAQCGSTSLVGDVTEREYPNCDDCGSDAVQPALVLTKAEYEERPPTLKPNLDPKDYWSYGSEQYEFELEVLSDE